MMFDAFLSECLDHFQDLSVSKKRERDHSTAAGAGLIYGDVWSVDQDDDLTVMSSIMSIVAHIVLHEPKEKETARIYSYIVRYVSFLLSPH